MPRIGRYFMPNMQRAAWGFMQSGDFPVPVGYWKLGKNTGNVAYDSGSGDNDGTIDGATWVKGYLGPGLSFDNLDDFVNLGDIHRFAGRAPFTLISRFKAEEATSAYPMLLNRGREAPTRDEFGLTLDRAGSKVITSRIVSGSVKQLTTSIVYGTWYEVAGVYDGDEQHLYLDGVYKSSVADTVSMPDLAVNMMIGRRTGASNWYKGAIDYVAIFDEALTAAQIRQIYLGYR